MLAALRSEGWGGYFEAETMRWCEVVQNKWAFPFFHSLLKFLCLDNIILNMVHPGMDDWMIGCGDSWREQSTGEEAEWSERFLPPPSKEQKCGCSIIRWVYFSCNSRACCHHGQWKAWCESEWGEGKSSLVGGDVVTPGSGLRAAISADSPRCRARTLNSNLRLNGDWTLGTQL